MCVCMLVCMIVCVCACVCDTRMHVTRTYTPHQNPTQDATSDDTAVVITTKDCKVSVSLLPLTHTLHPSSTWQGGEGQTSTCADWRGRISGMLLLHALVKTFQPPQWPFKVAPSVVDLPPGAKPFTGGGGGGGGGGVCDHHQHHHHE